MKKLSFLTLTFALLFCVTTLNAQFEVKINPIGFLFNSPDLSAEYLINDDIGVELVIGADYGTIVGTGLTGDELRKSGFRLRAIGKYYFSPNDGTDAWYAGVYLGPRQRTVSGNSDSLFDSGWKQTAFTAGFTGGYKWVTAKGIIFELGLGIGRAFNDEFTFNDSTNTTTQDGFGIDGFGRASVGYRF